MTGDFVVRDACVDDAPALAKVVTEAWEAAYRGLMPDSILDGLDEHKIAERIASRPWPLPLERRQLVVLDGDEIVASGLVGTGHDEEFAHLGELAYINCRPRWWGTGAGQLLHDNLCQNLQDLGHSEVYLWMLVGNKRATRFYVRNNWQATEHHKDDTKWGPAVREVQYRRTLND